MASLLFETAPTDLATYVSASALLFAIALLVAPSSRARAAPAWILVTRSAMSKPGRRDNRIDNL